MDTDWCIMCDSHCNTSGAIYCSEECKMQDRSEELVRTKKSSSSYNYDLMQASKLTASSKLLNQHQQFLFYHRSPISRHQQHYYAKKIIDNNLAANLNNSNTNNISRSLYV